MDFSVVPCVNQTADLRGEAGVVGRATGQADPVGTLRSLPGFQRVLIEKTFSGKREAGERRVVEREFHHIGVFGIAGHQVHAILPQHVGDAGTGLAVGIVRQQIGVAETLIAVLGGAEAAG